jgi:hypothetical protein
MLTVLSEVWTNNQWVNSGRSAYTYDANGNMLTELDEWWTNSQWVNAYRFTYTYDASANRLTFLREQWTNNQWVNSLRHTYTYDANGKRLTFLSEQWANNQWVNYARYTYTYDVNGNLTSGQYENWQGGVWVPSNSSFSVTDSAGNSYSWSPARKVMLRYRFITTDVAHGGSEIPTAYELAQNYPNPFNPSTKIRFEVRGSGLVSLKVFDVLGREVAVLVNDNLNAGSYETTFDAKKLASGVYFYKLHAGEFSSTKKMLLTK